MRAELIGHFEPCMTEIYLHIDARMADYICTHPYLLLRMPYMQAGLVNVARERAFGQHSHARPRFAYTYVLRVFGLRRIVLLSHTRAALSTGQRRYLWRRLWAVLQGPYLRMYSSLSQPRPACADRSERDGSVVIAIPLTAQLGKPDAGE